MKTKYFAIAIALLLIACLGLSVYFLAAKDHKAYVTVVQDGVVTMELDLGLSLIHISEPTRPY